MAQKTQKNPFLSPSLLNDSEVSDLLKTHKFSVVNTNVCSLHKHYEATKELSKDLNPTFIILTEIWQVDPKYYRIPNYHEAEMKVRSSKKGGGIAIFTSESQPKPKVFAALEKPFEYIEFLAVETMCDKTEIILCAIYRPPDKSFSGFLKELKSILKILADSKKKFIIGGDTNVSCLDQNANCISYLDLLDEFNVKQLVKGPTRITSTSRSNIDHFLSNIDFIKAFPTVFRIADHQTVICTFKESKRSLILKEK